MKTKRFGPLALLCVSLILVPASAFADGTISGVVINGFTGEPVRGATLTVEGTDLSFKAGVGGDFRTTAPAGTYTVIVSRDGFDSQRITGVVVADGGVADFAVVLLPAADQPAAPAVEVANPDPEPEIVADTTTTRAETVLETETIGGTDIIEESEPQSAADSGVFIGEITVEAVAEDSTEAALLAERKNAPMISDSIGTEEMKKSTGSDAADVVKRVTGISVQGDKYVYVRGLGERYSNTQLNGSKLPSTEFDRKVVPFDLFPSGLLEKIRVSKSFTVDKPGDFAAGFVEMDTLDFPAQQTASIGFKLGHHSIATGEQFSRYAGGMAWGGAGGQPLPASIPDEKLIRRSPITGVGFSPDELQQYGLDLIGDWRGTADPIGQPWGGGDYSAPLDHGYNASYGNTFGRFGVVVSGTYSNELRATEMDQNFYRVSDINESGIAPLHNFDIDRNVQTIKKGMVGNFAYKLSDNHHLKFRSLLNTISRTVTRFQEGFFSDLASDVREYGVNYRSQEMATFQLSGEHYLPVGALGSLLEWRGSTSTAETSQDMRFSLYQAKADDYILTDNSSSGFMYYNDLEDTVDDIGADWTTFLSSGNSFGSIKAGLSSYSSDRGFVGRRIRYKHRSVAGIDLTQAPEDLFSEEYIRPDGFEIEETTRPTDAYDAAQNVGAAYGQLDWNYKKVRFIGGVRYEASDIEVVPVDIFNPDREQEVITVNDRDWLPSLGLVYRLNQKQNLRFTASRTVNRPEFRELAPFKFTDAIGFFERQGNPNLVTASIQSFDARWEWFPTSADVIALSAFVKDFTDPIEVVIIEAVTRTETWVNSEKANNRGLEVEFRRTFNPQASHVFTTVLNYSYIDSEITIPEGGIQTNSQRRMVGQPDHVGNFVLEWVQPHWGSSMRLLYNYTGDRVAFAGANGLPDVIESSLGRLDLAFIQNLRLGGIDWKLKVTGENLTDESVEFTQGGLPFQVWEPGIKFGFAVGLTLF